MSDSEDIGLSKEPTELTIARWSDRFFAWLIDYVIIIGAAFMVFFTFFSTTLFEFNIDGDYMYSHTFDYASISIVFFLYWLILESKKGQSIGKMALNRKITNQKRQRIFNRLGKTIVIKVPQTDDEPENISYKKD